MSDDAEKLMDAVFDIADENQRLRERAAASEAALEAARSLLAMLRSDLRGCELSIEPTERRALKAEAERDEALAHVALLREALRCELPEAPRPHVLEVADAQAAALEESRLRHVNAQRARILAALASTPAPTRAEAEAWLRAGEPVRGALAVPAEPDYSGLCAAPSCEGHCGYVHARGCEAVREYLADHGGDPYRAPSPPDILRLAKRAAENAEAAAQLEIADAELRRSLVRNIITAFSPGCRLPDEEDLDWKEATRG